MGARAPRTGGGGPPLPALARRGRSCSPHRRGRPRQADESLTCPRSVPPKERGGQAGAPGGVGRRGTRPHRGGWSRAGRPTLTPDRVLPAQAGVVPRRVRGVLGGLRAPRTGGGGPL